ncbi:GDYXXLXY domain-containing protein [Bacillus suaedaesalsae]|uniref:GDYXXLXY domain-containing protein n=1 Tax=Bacillus suaedaesalsae TaxID=2810349 RepID=A0ABS2DHX3_9BACI|nr:GDYXXLXY domain-containing protein [Bacillus suaedaesalsae]MBM6617128.1 GDYXXLXY domain-containing protein [Bacillus suaedaesalsae]
MNKRLLFYGVILLQVLFLLGMAGSYFAIDKVGQEIRLKTIPIDPRDLFYGDYVTLQYEISNVPKKLWLSEELPDYGDRVYVLVDKGETYHKVVAASLEKLEVGEGEVLLSGRYLYEVDTSALFVEYGIEQYYIPENTGKEIENSSGNVEVYVKIAPWGQMKIDRIVEVDEKK